MEMSKPFIVLKMGIYPCLNTAEALCSQGHALVVGCIRHGHSWEHNDRRRPVEDPVLDREIVVDTERVIKIRDVCSCDLLHALRRLR